MTLEALASNLFSPRATQLAVSEFLSAGWSGDRRRRLLRQGHTVRDGVPGSCSVDARCCADRQAHAAERKASSYRHRKYLGIAVSTTAGSWVGFPGM